MRACACACVRLCVCVTKFPLSYTLSQSQRKKLDRPKACESEREDRWCSRTAAEDGTGSQAKSRIAKINNTECAKYTNDTVETVSSDT